MARLAPAAALTVAFVMGACFSLASAADPPPYNNYTVGGAAGWFFDPATNTSATNYSSWASSHSFYLGDFLIFRTNVNSTVIQTYNKTTYELCSLDQDYGNLTTQWTPTDGADAGNAAEVMAVPLTMEGSNYYFSSADVGIQCENGMRFQIVVGHGNGLPPELKQAPSPPAPPLAAAPLSVEASPSSQRETFYRGDGGGGRRGGRRLALAFFLCFLPLLLLPPPPFSSA